MALLPPFFLDTVVAIGVGDDPKTRTWIGTGFIYGGLLGTDADGKNRYRLWLITNKHVLADLPAVHVKFNSAVDPDSKDYKVPLIARNGKLQWVGHPTKETDVAAIFLSAGVLRQEQRRYSYFQSDKHVMSRDQMKATQFTEGDRVFVLGFPMGLVDPARQYVICRGGVVARVRDFLEGKASDFLVDATVFPGNSGGPVISCPAGTTIDGTARREKAELIGVVKSYVPYSDLAVSSQTRKPRIVFEENSGLAAVESSDAIVHTVALAERRFKNRIAQAKHKAKKTAVVAPASQPQAVAPAPPSQSAPPADPQPAPPCCCECGISSEGKRMRVEPHLPPYPNPRADARIRSGEGGRSAQGRRSG